MNLQHERQESQDYMVRSAKKEVVYQNIKGRVKSKDKNIRREPSTGKISLTDTIRSKSSKSMRKSMINRAKSDIQSGS